MQLCLLHLDDALAAQDAFLNRAMAHAPKQLDARQEGAEVRLWGKDASLERLEAKLMAELRMPAGQTPLVFLGSGDFHHITPLLMARALEQVDGLVTLIHFDNHPDWVKFGGGMHCGSWVNRAAKFPQVKKIITIGVCSKDLCRPEWKQANLSLLANGLLELYPYDHPPSRIRAHYGDGASYHQTQGHLHWHTIREMGEAAFAERLLDRITTTNVYITVDKDVLDMRDAITNWDQGYLRLPYLLGLIRKIAGFHRIIGADVTGDYSTPYYTGSLLTRTSKRMEIWFDQPHAMPHEDDVVEINSGGNIALLNLFSEVMA